MRYPVVGRRCSSTIREVAIRAARAVYADGERMSLQLGLSSVCGPRHRDARLDSIAVKENVGGGAIAIERAVDGASVWTALQFVAGSWPDRLKGFNRFEQPRK